MTTTTGFGMGDEFTGTDGGDAGATLQTAWFGGPVRGHLATGSSRHHMTISTCSAEVRRVLYAAGHALRLKELCDATGHGGAAIGSALTKLQQLGLVRKVLPISGQNYGCAYLWIGAFEPRAANLAGGSRRAT